MAFDIQKYVEDIVAKLTGDSKLLESFKKDPVGAVKKLLSNVDLDDDLLEKVVEAVKGKINLDDVAGKAKGILGFLKGIFGKK